MNLYPQRPIPDTAVPMQPYVEAHPLHAGHKCNDCGRPLEEHKWVPVPRYEIRICPRDHVVVAEQDGTFFYHKTTEE